MAETHSKYTPAKGEVSRVEITPPVFIREDFKPAPPEPPKAERERLRNEAYQRHVDAQRADHAYTDDPANWKHFENPKKRKS